MTPSMASGSRQPRAPGQATQFLNNLGRGCRTTWRQHRGDFPSVSLASMLISVASGLSHSAWFSEMAVAAISAISINIGIDNPRYADRAVYEVLK